VTSSSTVPEPASLFLVGTGLLCLLLIFKEKFSHGPDYS
ncbi:MAG: PEP-CTERM sorting domain-containing protein, partial [Terriglobia bacterium]